MSTSLSDSREQLLAADTEFRRLAEEHSRYAAQLDQITTESYRSAEDLLLESQLKKLKLRVKDQMEARAALLAHHLERTYQADPNPSHGRATVVLNTVFRVLGCSCRSRPRHCAERRRRRDGSGR